MPCSGGPGGAYDPKYAAFNSAMDAHSSIRKLRSENDELTRMLCSLLRTLAETNIKLPPDLEAWWRKHQNWDISQGR